MSDENTAVDGAQVATAETTATPPEQTQEGAQATTTEQVETQEQQEQRSRDEKGRFVPQERVNEITKARRTAERERDDYQRRVQELEQRLSQSQPSAPASEGVPTLEQYEWDHGKWAQALTEYSVRKATEDAEKRIREQERNRSQAEIGQKFEERARAYAAQHPDYEQAIGELSASVRLQPEVVESIGLSEHGPAIVHYLAQHLDVADRVSRLAPHLAAVEIGRIEARVSAPKPKPVTNAPTPGQTLAGGAAPQKGIRSDMSYADYKAARMAAS